MCTILDRSIWAITTLSTTLLSMFCEFMLHFKVIFQSLTGPDDTRHGWDISVTLRVEIVDSADTGYLPCQ